MAKRTGANAITVADDVLRKVDLLRGRIIPSDVSVTVTRHYGKTAAEKSNELLLHMAIAIISVSLLIMFTLGWRESGVVAVAIPSTLALTLLVFFLYGFTLNRITLFALIFSIGILVDDAIVVVENMVRHFHLPHNHTRPRAQVAIEAVSEVGNPTILATFTVIFAVLPMAFVGGLMGPYMRPIPIGAGAAMFFSLIIAFIVTPWAALRMLSKAKAHTTNSDQEDFFTRLYRRMMGPLIQKARSRSVFLVGITLLLLLAMGTVGIGWVELKMLPFDNKSEFQVILNMPEGSSLEHTARAAREIAAQIRQEPEVQDYQVYVGCAAPINFNGLVRHYFMRKGASVADLQINLVDKHARNTDSHDIVQRVRPGIAKIAERFGARVAVAEVPPGPPVLQTLVAEIYGPSDKDRFALASAVRAIFIQTPGVVDVDWYVEELQPKVRFVIDKEKAALHGVSAQTISQTLRIAVGGASVDLLHVPGDKEDVNLLVEVPRAMRTIPEDLLGLRVRSGDANALPEPTPGAAPPLIPLRELVHIERTTAERTIYHKNLMPVTYVIGDVAGAIESPVYATAAMNKALDDLDASSFGGTAGPLRVFNASQPFSDIEPALKWDGEWHITLEVFRDLGMAFAAVLVLIYILMVGWFRSFLTPIIVMAAIPFSLVGILPAHGAMGAFFTATSMIGFMAGAGIVVRNSIILVDFIELRLREGMPLAEAVVDAGAVRFRPMILTAMAVAVGASVILFDPIFQGLAISLIAGEVASLLISRMAVPVLYYMAYHRTQPFHKSTIRPLSTPQF
ncbi:MAG: efflux RND transporter permease subunit [Myxococcota bacterium]